MDAYFEVVESHRVHPENTWKGYDGISIGEERLLVCTCMLGGHVCTVLAMWESGELPSSEIFSFIESTFAPHFDGFIQLSEDLMLEMQSGGETRAGYSTIGNYRHLYGRNMSDLGKMIIVLTLIVLYLTEYWRTTPANRFANLPFPELPLFMQFNFFERCVNRSKSIRSWLDGKGYLDELMLTNLCDEFRLLSSETSAGNSPDV